MIFSPITSNNDYKNAVVSEPKMVMSTINTLAEKDPNIASNIDRITKFIERHTHKNVFDISSVFTNINEVMKCNQLDVADFTLSLFGKSFSKADMFIPHIDLETTFGNTYYSPFYNSISDGYLDYLSSYLDYKKMPLNKDDFLKEHMYARHENIYSGNAEMFSSMFTESINLSNYPIMHDIINKNGEKITYQDLKEHANNSSRNYEQYTAIGLMALKEPKALLTIAKESKTYIKCADIAEDCEKKHFNSGRIFRNILSSSLFMDTLENIDNLWKNSSPVITKDKVNISLYLKNRKKAAIRTNNKSNIDIIRDRHNHRA